MRYIPFIFNRKGCHMFKHLLCAAAGMLCLQAQAATVYKCTGESGKTIFSDRPCSASAEELTVKDNRIGGSFSPSDEWLEVNERSRKADEINRRYDRALRQVEAGPCKDFSSTEIRTMTIRNQVVVGMKASDATRAWGAPTRVNGWQHAYHWNKGGSSFFYVEQGCVTSVQGSYNG